MPGLEASSPISGTTKNVTGLGPPPDALVTRDGASESFQSTGVGKPGWIIAELGEHTGSRDVAKAGSR